MNIGTFLVQLDLAVNADFFFERLCINIGDQFARSVYYGRYKVIPIRTEIIRFCETLGMDYM